MHDFVSESFNRSFSYKYNLSIQLSLNGFSFCITDTEHTQLQVFKRLDTLISSEHLIARRFQEWFHEEDLLQLVYQKNEVIINSPHYSLVPEQLESEHLKKIISELLPHGKESDYTEGWIKSLKAKLIYQLPQDLAKTLTDTLKEYRLLHPVQKLTGYLKRAVEANHVLLFFDGQYMHLLLKKNNELEMSNCFRIHHANDALYFILSALQQFDLSSRNVTVETCGITLFDEMLKPMLKKYFKQAQPLLPLHLGTDTLDSGILSENLCLF